jgi:hypothetical protein
MKEKVVSEKVCVGESGARKGPSLLVVDHK